jgi:hypothetical protein
MVNDMLIKITQEIYSSQVYFHKSIIYKRFPAPLEILKHNLLNPQLDL